MQLDGHILHIVSINLLPNLNIMLKASFLNVTTANVDTMAIPHIKTQTMLNVVNYYVY